MPFVELCTFLVLHQLIFLQIVLIGTYLQKSNQRNLHTTSMIQHGNKEPLNMEKRNWKEYLRKLGWAGVIFFTVKGTITLLFGAWVLQKLGCEP